MAKVTLTFEDAPNSNVTMRIEFDPEIDTDDTGPGTPAQRMAVDWIERANGMTTEFKVEEST